MRAVVRKHLPKGYKETIGYGMICYAVPLSTYYTLGEPGSDVALRVHVPIHFLNETSCHGVKMQGGIVWLAMALQAEPS